MLGPVLQRNCQLKNHHREKFLRAAAPVPVQGGTRDLSRPMRIDLRQNWVRRMRSEAAILLLSESLYREVVASLFESEAILIKIR